MKRTESEIKAYVDGYNACFKQFKECLKGRKSLMDAIRKMDLFVTAVNGCVESEPQTERDRPQGEWIPCSDRLPEDIRPVLVTWKNTDPAPYYQSITGKHFIGAAHYHSGKWYWYSSVTEDLLAEYGECESEEFDEAIKAVAWMPLPKPWKGAENETN